MLMPVFLLEVFSQLLTLKYLMLEEICVDSHLLGHSLNDLFPSVILPSLSSFHFQE